MQRNVSIILIIFAACLLIVGGCSKPYVITTELDRPLAKTAVFSIGQITDEFPDDFDAAKKPTVEDIERFKHLIQSQLAETELFGTEVGIDTAQYEVQGSILDYKKGSGAVRFLIGFGAGNAKVTTALRLVNKANNEVVFAGNFHGTVSSWGEKGNKVFDSAAKNFAKALKKKMKEHNRHIQG